MEVGKLTEAEADWLANCIATLNLYMIFVWRGEGGPFLDAKPGCYIGHIIVQMVLLARAARKVVPHVEIKLNSKVTRAHADDDHNALFRAWDEAPWDCPHVVMLGQADGADEPEPRNNDGRDACFWCGAPTREIELATSSGNICTQCGR